MRYGAPVLGLLQQIEVVLRHRRTAAPRLRHERPSLLERRALELEETTPRASFARRPVWKSTSASGAPDNSSLSQMFLGDDGAPFGGGRTGTATPSSRRRVDGVEVDANAP